MIDQLDLLKIFSEVKGQAFKFLGDHSYMIIFEEHKKTPFFTGKVEIEI